MVKAGEGWNDKNGGARPPEAWTTQGRDRVPGLMSNKNSPMEMGERKLWLNTVRENLIIVNRATA
jgi:hypothetical protein